MKNRVFAVLCLLVPSLAFSAPKPYKNWDQRVSTEGAIFVMDVSHPSLGKAYRDPSGLIWGDVLTLQENAKGISQADAEKSCENLGARLPTIFEFVSLAKYLGEGTKLGYSPYSSTDTDKDDLIPGLSGKTFWSSSGNRESDVGDVFSGSDGQFYFIEWSDDTVFNIAVRCVVQLD